MMTGDILSMGGSAAQGDFVGAGAGDFVTKAGFSAPFFCAGLPALAWFVAV